MPDRTGITRTDAPPQSPDDGGSKYRSDPSTGREPSKVSSFPEGSGLSPGTRPKRLALKLKPPYLASNPESPSSISKDPPTHTPVPSLKEYVEGELKLPDEFYKFISRRKKDGSGLLTITEKDGVFYFDSDQVLELAQEWLKEKPGDFGVPKVNKITKLLAKLDTGLDGSKFSAEEVFTILEKQIKDEDNEELNRAYWRVMSAETGTPKTRRDLLKALQEELLGVESRVVSRRRSNTADR